MSVDLSSLPNLEIGSTAPDFNLKNQKGEDVQLSKVLASGKRVLLVFYPGDMTPGCTVQLCGIRDVFGDYEKAAIKVYGMNHKDAKSHQRFIDMHGYQFDILVDTDRILQYKYGAVKSFIGKASTKRGVFLIDTNGKILYKVWGQQDNQKILQFVADLR